MFPLVRAGGRAARERLASCLRLSSWDGFFASFSDNLIAPFLPLLAVGLGASPALVGWLIALPNLAGNSLQVVFGALSERLRGSRWGFVLALVFAGRFLWVPVGALAMVGAGMAEGERGALLWALVALATVRAAAVSAAAPGWTDLMARVVPRRLRGHYFATRNLVAGAAALAATLVAGWLLRATSFPKGYVLLAAMATATGVASAVFLARSVRLAEAAEASGEGGGAREPGRDGGGVPAPPPGRLPGAWPGAAPAGGRRGTAEPPAFWTWVGISGLLQFTVNVAVPLFPVYFVGALQGDEALWGTAQAASMLTTALSQRYWGRRVDRLGTRWVLTTSWLPAAVIPLLWLGAPAAVWILPVNLLAGWAWAGYNLAAFNMLLESAPQARRGRMVGVYNAVQGLATAAGPVLGGLLGEWLGAAPVLILSAAGRLGSWWLFHQLLAPVPLRQVGWRYLGPVFEVVPPAVGYLRLHGGRRWPGVGRLARRGARDRAV